MEVSFVYIGSDIVFLAFVFSLFGVNFSSVFLLRLLTSRFVSRDYNIPLKMPTPWKEFLDETDKPEKFEEKILTPITERTIDCSCYSMLNLNRWKRN